MSLVDGRAVVTTGGTRVKLSTDSVYCKVVDITAETDNTDLVVVGGASVVAALATRKGTPLAAGETKTFIDVDLSNIYIDAVVNTEGVTYNGY